MQGEERRWQRVTCIDWWREMEERESPLPDRMYACLEKEERQRGGGSLRVCVCVWRWEGWACEEKKRFKGYFHSRLCTLCLNLWLRGTHEKSLCVGFWAWKWHSCLRVPPHACRRACFCVRLLVSACFCVPLTNWRNTHPSAWWGWGSGCRLASTADNTSLCNSRMSSIFENRIYKQRDDVKGGDTEEGTGGNEQGSDP